MNCKIEYGFELLRYVLAHLTNLQRNIDIDFKTKCLFATCLTFV